MRASLLSSFILAAVILVAVGCVVDFPAPDKTVVLGDSITNQGYLREDGWVHQYANVVNEGHDGYTAQDLAAHLPDLAGATRVTLDIGTNDYLQARGCDCAEDRLVRFKAGFDAILLAIRNDAPCASLVVGELYDFGYLDGTRLPALEVAINAYIHEQVDGQAGEAVAPVAAAFGDSSGLILPDGVHPNAEGHARLAKAFSSVDPQPAC